MCTLAHATRYDADPKSWENLRTEETPSARANYWPLLHWFALDLREPLNGGAHERPGRGRKPFV